MPTTDLIGSLEAAEILHVNQATVTRWVHKGKLPTAVKAPGIRGARLFHREHIVALAQQRQAA
jgi:excisionase family DNA binding protein